MARFLRASAVSAGAQVRVQRYPRCPQMGTCLAVALQPLVFGSFIVDSKALGLGAHSR